MKFLSTVVLSILIVFIGWDNIARPVHVNLQIGTWDFIQSAFAESLLNEEIFQDFSPQDYNSCKKSLIWLEQEMLVDEKLQNSAEFSTLPSNIIPLYAGQFCDITWWAPFKAIIKVTGNTEELIIKVPTILRDSGIIIEVVYWQSDAYTKNYMHYYGQLEIIGDGQWGEILVNAVDYSDEFPMEVSGRDILKLPPFQGTREILFSITERPNKEKVVPIMLSSIEGVEAKVLSGNVWTGLF